MKFEIKTKSRHFTTPTAEELRKAYETRYNQKQAILRHLKKYKTLSTKTAHDAGILAPAARILELRNDGHIIDTIPIRECNRMAKYCLIKLAERKPKANLKTVADKVKP